MALIQIIRKGICLLILAVPQLINAPEPFFYLPTQTELRPMNLWDADTRSDGLAIPVPVLKHGQD
jgi:hypothetical protein